MALVREMKTHSQYNIMYTPHTHKLPHFNHLSKAHATAPASPDTLTLYVPGVGHRESENDITNNDHGGILAGDSEVGHTWPG